MALEEAIMIDLQQLLGFAPAPKKILARESTYRILFNNAHRYSVFMLNKLLNTAIYKIILNLILPRQRTRARHQQHSEVQNYYRLVWAQKTWRSAMCFFSIAMFLVPPKW